MTITDLAERLTEAQREYLRALEPNDPATLSDSLHQFHYYNFRKAMRGHSQKNAWALIRKGLVSISPEPCECGFHFVKLNATGQQVRAHLLAEPDHAPVKEVGK